MDTNVHLPNPEQFCYTVSDFLIDPPTKLRRCLVTLLSHDTLGHYFVANRLDKCIIYSDKEKCAILCFQHFSPAKTDGIAVHTKSHIQNAEGRGCNMRGRAGSLCT